MKAPKTSSGNGILACLSANPGHSAVIEQLNLHDGFVVAARDKLIDFVYFPLTSVLSSLTILADNTRVETAVIGREGMAPLAAFHGLDRAPEPVVVQVPGDAVRMSRASFDAIMQADTCLIGALHRFTAALFAFVGQTSGCNRLHAIEQRCARWLLQTHDRVPGDAFKLTHLFLSQMLGVRRSSVTVAAESLRDAGAITYTRGVVKIVARDILESRACGCYALVRQTYDRLLGDGVSAARPDGPAMDRRSLARETVKD